MRHIHKIRTVYTHKPLVRQPFRQVGQFFTPHIKTPVKCGNAETPHIIFKIDYMLLVYSKARFLVKAVFDVSGRALYFSRSPIPFIRGTERSQWLGTFTFLKHIGLYAYRREVLAAITRLPQSPLEMAESLEQLRWLQNGYRIKVGITDVETVGIDTPEDLERAEALLGQ